MTESEWLTCDDPLTMLEFRRGSPKGTDAVTWWGSRWRADEPQTADDRRFRLFACECCRRFWDRIPEPCNRDAVIAVEGYLDGRVTSELLEEALARSSSVEYLADGSKRSDPGYWAVKYLGRGFYKLTAGASALMVASALLFAIDEEYEREARVEFGGCFYAGEGVFLRPFRWPTPIPAAVRTEMAVQADLLRCVFGNPFRSVAFAPEWRHETALILARQMDESRTYDIMPILSDALQDAGCDDDDILDHCRKDGPHVRGCWVVDRVLNRE